MTIDIKHFLSNNNGNILIYGDVIIDEFKKTTTNRLSSEHPIPVFEDLPETIESLGGAGNVFMNILSFNQKCSILTILEEKYGKILLQYDFFYFFTTPLFSTSFKATL